MISFSPQERGISAVTASLELATSALTKPRSNQLSYATMVYSLGLFAGTRRLELL
jgi:hypothetical protein